MVTNGNAMDGGTGDRAVFGAWYVRAARMDVMPADYMETYAGPEEALRVSRWERHPSAVANALFLKALLPYFDRPEVRARLQPFRESYPAGEPERQAASPGA